MLRKREGAQAQYLVRFESGKMSSIQLVSLPKIVMLFIIVVVLLHRLSKERGGVQNKKLGKSRVFCQNQGGVSGASEKTYCFFEKVFSRNHLEPV